MAVPEPFRSALDAGRGSVSFSRFQELALYDPDAGFYATQGQAGGRRGDFITSVEVGPLFGAVIANALDSWWDELGRPDPFIVLEAAAGVGTLARTMVAAQPRCRDALVLHLVEISPVLRSQHPTGVTSHAELPEIGAHVVLANELLDNLPVDLFEKTSTGWAEVRVGQGDGRLHEILAPVGPGEVQRLEADLRLDRLAEPVPVGQRLPAPRRAERWLVRALELLEPGGRLVAIDYFRPVEDLVGLKQSAWLRTYRNHQRGGHPLDEPGTQDLTCDVRLPIGPREPGVSNQAAFLRRHGIDDLVAEGRRIWAEKASQPDLEAMRARSRIGEAEALLDADGLGGFFVCQWRP
ncbi:MAG: hypothetical protein GY929_00290 [Actinomycetia bacterium]|nr:hypothetical protein [Actinomycetes bacterium]